MAELRSAIFWVLCPKQSLHCYTIYAWVVDNIESAKREGNLGHRTNSKGAK
jgi:hypothetical protein